MKNLCRVLAIIIFMKHQGKSHRQTTRLLSGLTVFLVLVVLLGYQKNTVRTASGSHQVTDRKALIAGLKNAYSPSVLEKNEAQTAFSTSDNSRGVSAKMWLGGWLTDADANNYLQLIAQGANPASIPGPDKIFYSEQINGVWQQPQLSFQKTGYHVNDPSVIHPPSSPDIDRSNWLYLYYTALTNDDANSGRFNRHSIGFASSVDGGHTWTDHDIIINAQESGDDAGAWSPGTVVVNNEIWVYYHTGTSDFSQPINFRLRLSLNGFQKLGAPERLGFSGGTVLLSNLDVIRSDSVWMMAANTTDLKNIVAYTSSNGLTWSSHADNPIIPGGSSSVLTPHIKTSTGQPVRIYFGFDTDGTGSQSIHEWELLNFAYQQSPLFQNGDSIKTTANLNVRANPSLSGVLLGTQPVDSSGTIVLGGPIAADGYIWWNIHYDNAPSGWSIQDYLVISSPSSLKPGDRVRTTSNLNVRGLPSLAGNILGVQPETSLGVLLQGPSIADGYTWWNINYDNAPDGWSAQTYLTKISSPSPLPSPSPNPTPLGIETSPKVTSATEAITQTCDQLSDTTSQGYCWQTKAIVDGNPSLCNNITVTTAELSRDTCVEATKPPLLPFTFTVSPDQYELGDTVTGQIEVKNQGTKTILGALKVEFFHDSTLYSTENTPLNMQPSTTTMLSLDDVIGSSTLSTLPEGDWKLRLTQVSVLPPNTAETSFTIGTGAGSGGCSVSKAQTFYASTSVLLAVSDLGIPLSGTRFLGCDYGQQAYNQPPFSLNGYDGIIFFQSPTSGGVGYDSTLRLPTTTPTAFITAFFHEGGGSNVGITIEKGSTTVHGMYIASGGGGSNVNFIGVPMGTKYKVNDSSDSAYLINGTTTKQVFQGEVGQFP